MPQLRPLVLAAVLAISLAVPASGARLVVGSHFGLSYLTSEGFDDLLMIKVPGGGDVFVPFVQPGLRVGALDDAGRSGYFADLGLSVFNASGETLYGFQITGNYTYHFSADQPTSPFLSGALGMSVSGDETDSFDQLLYGIGLGMRINVGAGHGAGRIEARLDFIDPTDEDVELVTSYGLRFGFDLYGGP